MEIEYISHEGVVLKVDPSRRILKVRLTDADDCPDCPILESCGVGKHHGESSTDCVVEATASNPAAYKVGDKVEVRAAERLRPSWLRGITIVVSLLLIAVMVTVYFSTGGDQFSAAMGGIGVMVFAIVLTWLFKSRIPHHLAFTVG